MQKSLQLGFTSFQQGMNDPRELRRNRTSVPKLLKSVLSGMEVGESFNSLVREVLVPLAQMVWDVAESRFPEATAEMKKVPWQLGLFTQQSAHWNYEKMDMKQWFGSKFVKCTITTDDCPLHIDADNHGINGVVFFFKPRS